MPPPPENFPDGWDSHWQPSFENAQIAARPEPKSSKHEPVAEPRDFVPPPVEELEPEPAEEKPAATPAPKPAPAVAVRPSAAEIPAPRVPSLYVPVARAEDKDHAPQQITIVLRPTDDKERDKRRIRSIHGTLTSFYGRDRFTFQIFENGKGHLIDFPNDTTRICPEMLDKLRKLMGEESWRIEEIKFQ